MTTNCYDKCFRQIACDEYFCCNHMHEPDYATLQEDFIKSPKSCIYKNLCCTLEPCNTGICRKKYPKWYLDCHNGSCAECNITYGKCDIDKYDTCPFCLEMKQLYKINCGLHSYCLECINNFDEKICPSCGKSLWGN